MSDSIEDLVRRYKENVFREQHPRSIGLFTIPEYPEFEANRGMWSVALDAILTTLRYLAPATLLTLFWGQQSFLFKILKHIDSAFRAIVFSSEEQKQSVLQWLAEAGPVRVEHLETVWRHGWVLCGVLDAALPGACAGHPPIRLSLKHAQAIADHYLGVEPVFSRQELESNDSLSRHQEWKLATYLDRIRQALSKLTPPVSKPVSQRTSPETTQFTFDYVAKGSGLSAAQVNHKAYFKIYPTAQQALDPGEITILIRGPRDTYGMTVLPPILGKAQMIRQKLLGLQSKQTFTENVLPITQGATYLRSYGKNDMNKTYYIPKTKYDIEIEVEARTDHAKIGYVLNVEGKYLVSITSRGQSIVGSPFTITASNNIISILEQESFCLEDGEEIDIVDVKTDRKVVLRIVDFVTEKMLLKENGTLEKISDDEAKILMATENYIPSFDSETYSDVENSEEQKVLRSKRFNKAAYKILAMYRVCKIFNDLIAEKQLHFVKKENYIRSRSQQDIPDIVNSTLTETGIKPYIISELREKFIVPENISVSLRAEKSTYYDTEQNNSRSETEDVTINIPMMESTRNDSPDSLDGFNVSYEDQEDNVSVDRMTPSSTNNPFLNEMFEENYVASKNLGPFVASEYETHNSQNEETRDSSITIIIDPNVTPSPINSNPFMEADKIGFVKPDSTVFERPKTPVFKIISGEKVNRDESVFVDPKSEQLNEEALGNEFVNPFFMHHHQSGHFEKPQPMTDFIIGAPVSLPPILRARSPEPEIKALVIPGEKCKKKTQSTRKRYKTQAEKAEETKKFELLTPLQNNLTLPKDGKKENISAVSSTFHSLESNLTETTFDNSNASTTSDNQYEPYQIDSDRNLTPRKDIWDSAYVSIDDNNSSPDSNNNESTTLTETLSKQKFSPSDDTFGLKQEEISNMGPAEREIWQTCNELKIEPTKSQEEPKPYKWEIKRPTFTPIIEESDRSISSGTKDLSRTELCTKQGEADSVSVAFAELNDMYQEYFPNSETSSITIADELNKLHTMEVEFVKQTKDDSVDSASEATDVKRHVEELEGTISEVQTNVTESVSVSQPLRIETDKHVVYSKDNKDETQFGETSRSNIVLEKKKYWDERIRQIEAKSAETTTLPKKKRISTKQLKHDSLTKRKGKQIVKNFLSAGDYSQVKTINLVDDKELEIKVHEPVHSADDLIPQKSTDVDSDEKIVGRWKKYWDDKLETDQVEAEAVALRLKSPKNKVSSLTPSPISSKVESPVEIKVDTHCSNVASSSDEHPPVKQELPEEVFKAFETSPKRFFGTSRQQILNKIDTFLGKPATVDIPTADITSECHESGLVSSRISLFHNLSNTEELPWARRKSQSLQNVSQKRESEKSVASFEDTSPVKTTRSENLESRVHEATNVNITETVNLKNKRARMVHTSTNSKTFDETIYVEPVKEHSLAPEPKEHVRMAVKDPSRESQLSQNKGEILRKKSFSKSEMDIFNKIPNDMTDDGLDKYKSCDELPKINVKNFISLYESVTKTAAAPKPAKRVFRTSSADSQKLSPSYSITSDAVQRRGAKQGSVSNCESKRTTPGVTPTNLWTSKDSDTVSNFSIETRTSGSFDIEIMPNEHKETTYLSLSDIELEIIECSPDKSSESSPEREIEPAHIGYKNRFKLAKEYFQSIEELREIKKPRKLNECEQLLQKQSTESLELERPQKRVKKNIKAHSMPSAEISKIWNQLQESQGSSGSSTKLVKISEKFNVDDLFTDVTEGKLSRQGSLRGIPHKKAVLEAFRSMENIAPTNINSYEFAESQLTDFAKEHTVKNAQTYLSEYPYLPTTDPSKYHSRLDIKASGLISLKELKMTRPRRNSVPDLRLNPKFTVDL